MSCKTCHWSRWNGERLHCALFNKDARYPCVKWERYAGAE